MGLILLWQALIVLLHLIGADLTAPWAQFLRPQALEFGIGVLGAWLALSPRLRGSPFAGILSLALGCIAAWAFQMGPIGALQGPLAVAAGGVDLSWLAGIVVSGGAYLLLHRHRATGTP